MIKPQPVDVSDFSNLVLPNKEFRCLCRLAKQEPLDQELCKKLSRFIELGFIAKKYSGFIDSGAGAIPICEGAYYVTERCRRYISFRRRYDRDVLWTRTLAFTSLIISILSLGISGLTLYLQFLK